MKHIKIYQLKDISKYGFMSYSFAKRKGFTLNDYALVYECNRSDEDSKLDSLFFEFNQRRPKDFTGHSLSVSDIVEIDDSKYYCDDCGWAVV